MSNEPGSPKQNLDFPTESQANSAAVGGSHIGPYKLLQQIGEGGMGTVWMAEQERPVRRRVALKVIKAGMDSKQVLARFEAERQALSMMDHPHIAKVLDAGMTEEGRPYFAMELVQGIPFTQYCDRNRLSINERLSLFVPVCQAIQHAHQKGIIHRDLKPSNVLVTVYDGKPVPKVIDFGLAKALQHELKLTDKTMFTEFGQVVGTLRYMSPEQAEMNALDVDTRTDVYSLGVMLYELLTGSTPLDQTSMLKMAQHKILEQIREVDPPRPSTKLSDSGDAINGISAQRQIAPSRLQQILRGELDWIVMKTLEKDRTRRYESASEFAQDIQRYLNDEAVVAKPPSTTYRLSKFVKKNRVLVGSTCAFMAVLVAGVGGTSWFALAEKAQREIADRKTKDAESAALVAEQARTDALAQTRRSEQLLYLNQLAIAQREWELNNAPAAWDQLEACSKEMRGWEHSHLVSRFTRNRTQLKEHTSQVRCIAVSSDSARIASASPDGTIVVWDASKGEKIRNIRAPRDVYCLAFSPDGKRIAVGGGQSDDFNAPGDGPNVLSERRSGFLRLWDSGNGQEIAAFAIPDAILTSVVFLKDGLWLAGAAGRNVKVWDSASGTELVTLKGHQQPVNCVATNQEGTLIASCSGYAADDAINTENSIKIWDVASGKQIWDFSGHAHSVNCVAFDPSGKRIASGSRDHTLKIWDTETGRELLTCRGHEKPVLAVAFDSSGEHVVSGSADNTIRLWNVATGETTQILRGHLSAVQSVCVSPDREKIVSGSDDKTVVLWDWQRGEQPLTFEAPSPKQLTFGNAGLMIAAIAGHHRSTVDSAGDQLRVWNSRTGKQVLTLEERIGCFSFTPDDWRFLT